MRIDKASPSRTLAGILAARREEILGVYRAGLEAVGSALLLDPEAEQEAMAQAGSILGTVCEWLAEPEEKPDQGLGLLFSRDIGSRRAARRVHPTESLGAAAILVRVVMDAAREACAGQKDADAALVQASVVLMDTLLHRLQEGAAAYAGFLLEEVRQANDHERRRISRELHDRVSYGLNAAHRQLELIEMYAERDPDPVRLRERLQAAERQVVEAIDTTRRVGSGLRLELSASLLGESLRRSVLALNPTGVRVEVSVNGDENWLAGPVHEEVFLILREAMRNALAHARPQHLVAKVDIAPHELRAEVWDDGIGFSSTDVRTGGGMRSIQERADLIGASVRIHSRPGQGTSLKLVVGLSAYRMADEPPTPAELEG